MLCQSEGTHQIVMSYAKPVVGCLLKKGFQKDGQLGTPGPPLVTHLENDALGGCLPEVTLCMYTVLVN